MSYEYEEQRRQVPLERRCANHFEIAFTEFEFLLDIGQAFDNTGQPIIHTRLIVTPHSAETLVSMMTHMLADYTSTVGPIQRRKE